MKEIYKKARKSAAALLLGGGSIFLVLGIIMIFVGCPHLFGYLFAKAPDLFETPSSEYADGKWFRTENNILFDYYSYNDKGRCYVTATDDLEYFGFFIYNDEIDKAEEICNGTYGYFGGLTDDFSDQYICGKGYFKEMSPSEKKFFEDSFNYEGDTVADYDVVYLTFYKVTLKQALTEDADTQFAIFGVIGLIIGLVCVISFLSGGYKSGIKKAIKKYGILEELLEKDMQTAVQIGNAYVGNEHTVFFTQPNTFVIPYNALVWAYVQVERTQHRTYGIKTGTSTTYRIIMWDINKKKNMVNVKDEALGNQIIDAMMQRAPYFYRGYNEELANMTDGGRFGEMVSAVEQKRLSLTAPQGTDPVGL